MISLSNLQQTARDLQRKGHIRKNDQRLFSPESMRHALRDIKIEGLIDFSCKTCGISIRAPRKWAIAHHKSHVSDNRREGDQNTTQFNVYRV